MTTGNLRTNRSRLEHVQKQLNRKDDWTSEELTQMADLLLTPYLSNRAPNKVQTDEYPILSEQQLKRRQQGCVSYEQDYLKDGDGR